MLSLLLLIGLLLVARPKRCKDLANWFLIRLKREPLHVTPTSSNAISLILVYTAGWFCYGLSGFTLIYALELPCNTSFFSINAAFVTSWLIGFLSMITPGGLGVREATLVYLLKSEIHTAEAIALALVLRFTWTMIELAGVLLGLLLKSLQKD
jgi:uncharacterized membrane protein YbhN (UPF0104 family)